jgi:hypothetical protein
MSSNNNNENIREMDLTQLCNYLCDNEKRLFIKHGAFIQKLNVELYNNLEYRFGSHSYDKGFHVDIKYYLDAFENHIKGVAPIPLLKFADLLKDDPVLSDIFRVAILEVLKMHSIVEPKTTEEEKR